MVRSLYLSLRLIFALWCGIPTTLLAQEAESIEQIIHSLSISERNKLLEILLANRITPTEETLKSALKNLGPEKQAEIRDYVALIKSTDYQPSAQVEFSVDTIDFGRVKIGTVLRKTVTFRVLGDDAYILRDYKSSCPYLKVHMPESEFPFMPGEQGEFVVSLDTRRLTDAAPLRLVVSMRGNNAPHHRKLIYVKADLYSQIDYSGREVRP